ncbi:MAG: DNA-formamidopyrimidine glycosylase family protein, partial [Candidatus Binataceae bacterium]
MPELPEVESLRRILARSATGRGLVEVRVTEARLRRAVAPDFARMVTGRTIERIERRAKYLLIHLSGGRVMMVHLGMSGSLTHRGEEFGAVFNPRHDHVTFVLDDGSCLVYNDPRRFGLIKLLKRNELGLVEELKGLGPEPLSDEFNAAYLFHVTRGRT